MGKQKSYIMVGSVFLAFILLMLLVTIITSNVKDTKITFDSETYTVEIGKSRALTPTIYAGGKSMDDAEFVYVAGDNSVIDLQAGCYAAGDAVVDCWAFVEAKEDGSPETKLSNSPYHEDDVVTVGDDLYWYVNGEKTRARANKKYTEEEISHIVSKAPNTVNCFYLNGEPTNIPYNKDITPVRNESTGTWFIDGVDTLVKYQSIPATITGLKLGTSKVSMTAKIGGKEYKLEVSVTVCAPDPTGIEIDYIDATKIVSLNSDFTIDYKVLSKNENHDAIQDVKYSCPNGLKLNDGVFTAEQAGTYSITVTVLESSFQLGTSKNISKVVKVIVIDASEDEVELIEEARSAIDAIGTLVETEECKARYEAAKEAVAKVSEDNLSAITNIKKYEAAQNKFETVNE